MVETRKGIPSKAKLALRPMTILASLTRRQRSLINVPLRGNALDPAPARSARGLPELYEKTEQKLLTVPTTLYTGPNLGPVSIDSSSVCQPIVRMLAEKEGHGNHTERFVQGFRRPDRSLIEVSCDECSYVKTEVVRGTMARVRILLADDHTLFCNLLRQLLEPEYEVVGSVSNGRELLTSAETLRPDVVLVDIGMPSLNGLDAGRRLKKANPKVKLIYLTMNNDVEYAREALQAGASAFVLKNSESSNLLQAIRDALRGVSYVAPEIRQAMNEIFVRDPKAVVRPQHLTDRQREVLQMLAEGRSLREIATSLHISYRTVRFHKVRIMEELGISKNAELVQYAMKHGIISAR